MGSSAGSWGQVAAIATAISVSVSLLVSIAWRFFDSRRASWAIFNEGASWDSPGNPKVKIPPPSVAASLANTGDGDAFTLTVVGLGCVAWLEPNQASLFVFGLTPRRTLLPRLASGAVTNIAAFAEPSAWDEASIAVIWTVSPTRFRRLSRRVRYIPLTTLSRKPSYGRMVSDPDTLAIRREDLPNPSEPLLGPDQHPLFPVRPGWRQPVRRLRLAIQLHQYA